MLLFIDGFDHYNSAGLAKKWTSVAGGSINASSGRRGSGAYEAASSSLHLTKTLTAGASFVTGFAFKITTTSGIPAAGIPIAVFLDGGTVQCDLRINPDGTLSVTRNGTAVTGGTSSNTLSTGVFYYVEWKLTIANSVATDSCKVRVDGGDWITVAAGQDLQATANASANAIRIGDAHTGTGSLAGIFDDFYVCDQSGTANNDFLGDCRIDTLFPNGDGTYQDGTPSAAGSHYVLVDEATPNTTDYVDLGTTGNKETYTFGDLAALTSQAVYGVQVNVAAAKDDAGVRSVGVTARSGSTDSDKTGVALSSGQLYYTGIYETDPATAAAWTEAGVNSAQFGVKCTS